MAALGTSLIVLGLAFVCSGLVFLLPTSRLQGGRTARETFDESEDRAPFPIQQRRQERRS
jgi:hypothetical protein